LSRLISPVAGKGKGMSDTSTRSGMLWEVERILIECYELGSLPQILLMENVPQIHNEQNIKDFHKWQVRLEELGYKNYWQDLIATDYGIPQTRNRTFMVSILGNYSYTFPKPISLKLKLKDMLEDNVEEKYYLSDKMINCLLNESKNSKFPRKERFLQTLNTTNKKGIAATLCTTGGTRATDNFILTNKSLQETLEQNEINDTCYIDTYNKRIDKDKSGTITTRVSASNNTFLAIKNATKQGYLEAEEGDGVDISSRMENHRGTVQKNKIQTITTSGGNDRGVVINPLKGISGKSWQFEQQVYDENGSARTLKASEGSGNIPKVVTRGNYSPSNHNASRVVDKEYCAPTVMENHGTVTATQTNDLRIRKLTPRECFRLMGVKDEDFDKVKKNQSDSSLYHLAGDSIVVNVIKFIFNELIRSQLNE